MRRACYQQGCINRIRRGRIGCRNGCWHVEAEAEGSEKAEDEDRRQRQKTKAEAKGKPDGELELLGAAKPSSWVLEALGS